MSTLTPNYQFVLPGVGDPTDQDLWGGYLNSNLSSQDDLIKTATDWVKNEQSAVYVSTLTDRNKIILCDATGGAFNVTLLSPAVAGDGFAVMVKKSDASANAITVIGTIDGASNFSLAAENDYVILISDGVSNWNVVSKTPEPLEFASAAEVKAGVISDKAVAPDTIPNARGVSKGWARCNSAGTIIKSSGGISVSKAGTGVYNITFSVPFADANYLVLPWGDSCVVQLATFTTGGFNLQTYASPGFGLLDKPFSFIIMDN